MFSNLDSLISQLLWR